MYPVIVCSSCGRCLGDIYVLWMEMRKDELGRVFGNDYREIDPVFVSTMDIDAPMEKILDALNLRMLCCRAILLSQIRFSEVY